MIFLSAGHSNVDPGATATYKDVAGKPIVRKEADIVVEFRNIVSFYLSRAKIKHTVDGTGTDNLPLNAAVTIARKHSIAIEFHCNSGPPTAAGVETLQNPKDTALGNKICSAIATAMNTKNRGAKPENSGAHHRLAFVQAGGIIVELFFISNATELATYDAKKWLIAKAVADVLINLDDK
jgi:N-acetylmuramoyl-L-alanine amidase